jgi:hypothetical protein
VSEKDRGDLLQVSIGRPQRDTQTDHQHDPARHPPEAPGSVRNQWPAHSGADAARHGERGVQRVDGVLSIGQLLMK